VYDYVSDRFKQKYDLTWLKPIGFNNAYALMMRREQSSELDIHSISELTNYVENSEK
jgi:osmoprotectant transport system permease protein